MHPIAENIFLLEFGPPVRRHGIRRSCFRDRTIGAAAVNASGTAGKKNSGRDLRKTLERIAELVEEETKSGCFSCEIFCRSADDSSSCTPVNTAVAKLIALQPHTEGGHGAYDLIVQTRSILPRN